MDGVERCFTDIIVDQMSMLDACNGSEDRMQRIWSPSSLPASRDNTPATIPPKSA